MDEREGEAAEAPATWENVVVGKVKEAVGRVFGDEELAEEGEDQEDVAREVRDEFEEHRSE